MIAIIIASVGAPEMLALQLQGIRQFVSAPHQVYIVDDSRARAHWSNDSTTGMPARLRAVAREHGARYLRITFAHHALRKMYFPKTVAPLNVSPSARNADALHCGMRSALKDGHRRLAIFDSDLLPFAPWLFCNPSAEGYAPVRFLDQTRLDGQAAIHYPWAGYFYADLDATVENERLLWDLDIAGTTRLDTAGAARYWLAANEACSATAEMVGSGTWSIDSHPGLLPREFYEALAIDRDPETGMQFCDVLDGTLLHLRSGSNWMKQDPSAHQRRRSAFLNAYKRLLDSAVS